MNKTQKQLQIVFEIDADLVKESNRMWRRRFVTVVIFGVMLGALIYAFVDIWVMT